MTWKKILVMSPVGGRHHAGVAPDVMGRMSETYRKVDVSAFRGRLRLRADAPYTLNTSSWRGMMSLLMTTFLCTMPKPSARRRSAYW